MNTVLKKIKNVHHFNTTSVLIVSILIVGFIIAIVYVMYQGFNMYNQMKNL
jgi:hypothetical protein